MSLYSRVFTETFDPSRSPFKGLGDAVHDHLGGLADEQRVTSREIADKLGSHPTHVNAILLAMQRGDRRGRRIRYDRDQRAWFRPKQPLFRAR